MMIDIVNRIIEIKSEEEIEALLYMLRPKGEWEKCSLGFDCNK